MDPDPFECPICLSVFQGSIFQCKNGHAVCEACHARIHGTCTSCREPVGDIRCRALEDVIAGMALPCSFRSHGCTQLLKHTERPDHEAFHCQHAPFSCPLQGCPYSGLLLYDHIKDAHTAFMDYKVCLAGSPWKVWLCRSMPFRVLLDPVHRRVFLLLNGGDVPSGRSLSVVCLGPRPAANQLLEYKLEVGGAGEPGALSLSASCSLPCMRSWAGQYPDRFLFVPDACWSSRNFVLVNVNVHALARLLRCAWTGLPAADKKGEGAARKAMDQDLYKCPICVSVFHGSIFQCKNGHVVCETCHARIQGTCPSCREPVGDIRCRALENVIARMALHCSFRNHGCTQLLKPIERPDHEAFHCQHAPSACPFQGCPYSGLLLYDHIKDAHSCLDYVVSLGESAWRLSLYRSNRSWPFRVLLDPVDRRVFLLLNGGHVHWGESGRSLSVVCLGLRPAAKQLLEYKLEVEVGVLSLSAASCSLPCMRSWEGQYPDVLFVPDTCWSSSDCARVDVNVCRRQRPVI